MAGAHTGLRDGPIEGSGITGEVLRADTYAK